jgi:ribosomal protein L11 methylase PrmA
MSLPVSNAGSFRDPGGRVFIDGSRVLRAVYEPAIVDYEAARGAGLLDELISRQWLAASKEIAPADHPAGRGAAYLLEHPRLQFISYPYEWPFSLHKRAALFHLDLLLDLLERNFTLSDATAYNVQFIGTKPVFIDHLSIKRYAEGELWAAHRQFCMQFLNPLVMWSKLGVSPNAWFRGSLEGIPPEDLARLLGWRDNLSWTILAHVTLQGAAQRRAGQSSGVAPGAKPLSKSSFKAMLIGLRDFISSRELPRQHTVWDRYATENSYGDTESDAKHRFVRKMAATVSPPLLFDLGCNSGDYSLSALEAGAHRVIAFDFDFGALERAVERSDRLNLPLLPLWLDAMNPSPAQGWNQQERMSFAERSNADALLALAFIHHLAIARNVPLDLAIDWIMSVAPVGVIEFPPKSDPMVQRLLSRREDIFPDYTEDHFLAEVRKRGRIVEAERLSPGGRLMVWYDRTAQR